MQTLDSYTYVTSARMAADALRLSEAIGVDVAAVVGVARSGMLPAGIIACVRHVPLFATDADGGGVTPLGHGGRFARGLAAGPVLLVDDTVCSGYSMSRVLPAVKAALPDRDVITAAIYSTEHGLQKVDRAAVLLESPHYLEWNYFNSSFVGKAAFDLDGILCPDVPRNLDDNGPRYAAAIAAMPPRHLPRRITVPAIVTARLERWREATVAWLERWGVRYRQLIMGPWDNLADRRQVSIGHWKGGIYRELPLAMFVESDPQQAREIAAIAQKPVMCPSAERVFVGQHEPLATSH